MPPGLLVQVGPHSVTQGTVENELAEALPGVSTEPTHSHTGNGMA